MKLKVFTWNMQRGSSISPDPLLAKKPRTGARKELLRVLCEWADVGFITEASKDLVLAASSMQKTSDLLPEGPGCWSANKKPDGQKGVSDCKNLLFCKGNLTPFDLTFKSGGQDAFRYPASGIHTPSGEPQILFVAFHATSGGGGWSNSNGLLDFFDEKSSRGKGSSILIAGGDMNSNHRHFKMPKTPTHQSGSILDGFVYETLKEDEEYDITFPMLETFLKDGKCTLVCATAGSSTPAAAAATSSSSSSSEDSDDSDSEEEAAKPIGYFVHGNRVSDHAPVIAEIVIKRSRSGSESDD